MSPGPEFWDAKHEFAIDALAWYLSGDERRTIVSVDLRVRNDPPPLDETDESLLQDSEFSIFVLDGEPGYFHWMLRSGTPRSRIQWFVERLMPLGTNKVIYLCREDIHDALAGVKDGTQSTRVVSLVDYLLLECFDGESWCLASVRGEPFPPGWNVTVEKGTTRGASDGCAM